MLMSDEPHNKLRLAIITSGLTTPTETFIRAHLDLLPFEVIHLYGYDYQYFHRGQSLRSLTGADSQSGILRFARLLPEVISFRLRRRFAKQVDDRYVLGKFLKDQRIDVVLAEYGMIGAFLAPVCNEIRIPLVVHFHGADASQRQYLDLFGDRYRAMFQSAAVCVAVSEKMLTDIVAMGCESEKILLCPYGPNDRFFDCRPDYNSDQIIAIGRLTPKKAPHLTILAFAEALKTCPNLRLVIIGDGELRGVCEDLIASLGLEGRVALKGVQTPTQISDEINHSFVFVQHSVQALDGDCEGTPVSVLEAGAAGLPVVSTRHAGIVDVVKHGETGLLGDERDIEAMSDSILLYANDRRLAEATGLRAREHIRTNFSMAKHLNLLSTVIHGVADSRNLSNSFLSNSLTQCPPTCDETGTRSTNASRI